MDIEYILDVMESGQNVDHCDIRELIAENARLQSVIDAANAQEPIYQAQTVGGLWSDLNAENYAKHAIWRIVYASPIPAQQSPAVSDYEEVLSSHRELVRELDVLLNGDGAAKQASLCDLVSQVAQVVRAENAPLLVTGDKVLFNGSHGHAGYVVDEQQSPAIEVTPDMLRAAQLNTEIGKYICSRWAGAYSCITELFNVMLAAAPNQSPAARDLINAAECSERTWKMSYEQVVKELERLQEKAITIPYVDVTDDMIHAAFKHSKIGGYVRSNWSGADDAITEVFKVMLDAAPKQSPAVAVPEVAITIVNSIIEQLNSGFIVCGSCGDQEDTKDMDIVHDLNELREVLLSIPTSPRITEQDAEAIIESYVESPDCFNDWIKDEGRDLLNKLNKVGANEQLPRVYVSFDATGDGSGKDENNCATLPDALGRNKAKDYFKQFFPLFKCRWKNDELIMESLSDYQKHEGELYLFGRKPR